MRQTNRNTYIGALVASAALLCANATTSMAADFGGDCCADLEERIAELEATTARKGNRKVSLQIYGHVNSAVMFWDDGHESNAYIVNNQNDQHNFGFTGDAQISADWSAGYSILIRLQNALSGEVSQDDDDAVLPSLLLWESYWFLESKTYGRVSVGRVSRVSDGAPEQDLSETGLPGYAGVQDIGGGLALRRSNDGGTLSVGWGDIYSHFNGDTAELVRYDTPSLEGFTLSFSAGEDDLWDVGIAYEGKVGNVAIAGAVAYTENTDATGQFGGGGEVDFNIIVGSIAFLHEPSGLNALIAGGIQSFDNAVVDADGIASPAASLMPASFIPNLVSSPILTVLVIRHFMPSMAILKTLFQPVQTQSLLANSTVLGARPFA